MNNPFPYTATRAHPIPTHAHVCLPDILRENDVGPDAIPGISQLEAGTRTARPVTEVLA